MGEQIVLDDNLRVPFDEEGITFTIRPEEFGDTLQGMMEAGKHGFDLEPGKATVASLAFGVLPRVIAWEGPKAPVMQGGGPAPCTPGNVRRFFGKRPDLAYALAKKVLGLDVEADPGKKSEPSQDGA